MCDIGRQAACQRSQPCTAMRGTEDTVKHQGSSPWPRNSLPVRSCAAESCRVHPAEPSRYSTVRLAAPRIARLQYLLLPPVIPVVIVVALAGRHTPAEALRAAAAGSHAPHGRQATASIAGARGWYRVALALCLRPNLLAEVLQQQAPSIEHRMLLHPSAGQLNGPAPASSNACACHEADPLQHSVQLEHSKQEGSRGMQHAETYHLNVLPVAAPPSVDRQVSSCQAWGSPWPGGLCSLPESNTHSPSMRHQHMSAGQLWGFCRGRQQEQAPAALCCLEGLLWY